MGGSGRQNFTFQKVLFKMHLGHSEPFLNPYNGLVSEKWEGGGLIPMKKNPMDLLYE